MKKKILFFASLMAFFHLYSIPIWEKVTPKNDKESDFEPFDEVLVTEKEAEFIIGEGLFLDVAKRKIRPFYMNKYETTYKLWFSVKEAAEKIGYHFANPGQEGTDGKRGKAPDKKENLPVVNITWYDAVVWCNAFSELFSLTPCYTYKNEIVKDSAVTNSLDFVECDFTASGFRLPTESEWEFAARKTKNGMNSADKASLDFTKIKTKEDEKNALWTDENAECAKGVGTATGQSSEEAFSSSGTPNESGIFDMSGNVMEFCFDWYGKEYEENEEPYYSGIKFGSAKVSRGGSYSKYTPGHLAGDRYFYDPNEFYSYMGFRFVRNYKSESAVKEKL